MIGDAADAARDIERSRQLAIVLSCAESVGAMHAAFDLTVAWAFDRYSFGRPLASYQELKHRFADMKTWLEASHGLADAAAAAVAADSPTPLNSPAPHTHTSVIGAASYFRIVYRSTAESV